MKHIYIFSFKLFEQFSYSNEVKTILYINVGINMSIKVMTCIIIKSSVFVFVHVL